MEKTIDMENMLNCFFTGMKNSSKQILQQYSHNMTYILQIYILSCKAKFSLTIQSMCGEFT